VTGRGGKRGVGSFSGSVGRGDVSEVVEVVQGGPGVRGGRGEVWTYGWVEGVKKGGAGVDLGAEVEDGGRFQGQGEAGGNIGST